MKNKSHKKDSNKIIDAHCHIFYQPSLFKSKKILLKSMKKYHVDYAIFSLDATEVVLPDRDSSKAINTKWKNAFNIALNFKKHHKNLFALLWIKPKTTPLDDIKKIDEYIKKHLKYIKGLKFHPFLSQVKISDEIIKPYIQIARKYKLPLLVHTAQDEYSDVSFLEKVAKKNKDINFIAAHLNLLSDNQKAVEILERNENIYGDTAWVDIKIIKQLKEKKLLHKIMFGTDNPIDGLDTLNNPMYQEYYKNSISLSDKEYNNLMFDNAKRIYKLNI